MRFSALLSKIERLITVPRCVACDAFLKDTLPLCPACLEKYADTKRRTRPCCGKPICACTCPPPRLRESAVQTLVKVTRYAPEDAESPVAPLLFSVKQSGRRDTLRFLSDEMERAIREAFPDGEGLTLVPIPRSGRAKLLYGYDQSENLAKRLAQKLGADYLPILASKAAKRQKGLTLAERRKNAVFGFKRNRPADLSGRRILLVDDIVTTGATVVSAKETLRSLGARKVTAACFAIAYDDKTK